ncbi:MAG: prepilin-type N-terminal cleavage/methylation domain-containing protein [Candidatus Hydrogenedentes bacterium]|nr:prepilin-type N-terminal cleavage/methylation domain-containing protein [Candidatus Hydrogenedentota bacterium]
MAASNIDRENGFTLVELTVAVAILVVLMGVLFSLSLGIGDTAAIQDLKIRGNDEARRGLLAVAPRLRQAVRETINLEQMPTDILTFRMPEDLDGNGLAVNGANALELGPEVEIRRDKHDQNKDGMSQSQLIMISGESIRVLANGLSPAPGPTPSPASAKGTAQSAENTAGFWVAEEEGGIRVTIRTLSTSRRGHEILQEFNQLIAPRN